MYSHRVVQSTDPAGPTGRSHAPDEIYVRAVVVRSPLVVRCAGPIFVLALALTWMVLVLAGVIHATAPDPRIWLS